MPSQIIVKRISGSTTFKVLYIGFLAFHIVSTLLIAVLVAAGTLPLDSGTSSATESMAPLVAVGAVLRLAKVMKPDAAKVEAVTSPICKSPVIVSPALATTSVGTVPVEISTQPPTALVDSLSLLEVESK